LSKVCAATSVVVLSVSASVYQSVSQSLSLSLSLSFSLAVTVFVLWAFAERLIRTDSPFHCQFQNKVYQAVLSHSQALSRVSDCLISKSYRMSLRLTSESRTWGHEAKQRPRRDEPRSAGLVFITDPTLTALGDAVIRGWQTFVNIVSVQHGVYLQVYHTMTAHTHARAPSYWVFTRSDRRTNRSVRLVCPTGRTDWPVGRPTTLHRRRYYN